MAGRDLVALTQQLATLVEAGLPLDRALAIQAELAPTPRLRAIMADVLRSVQGGAALADALGKHHPRPFSRLYINMVRAGEKGGVLETTLRRLAEFLEESQEFRDALVSALIYPVLLTGVGAAAVIFLMTFVIPRFAAIFKDLGATIPLPTLILLEASGFIQHYWWLLALLAAAGVLGSRMVLATPRGRLGADRMLLRLPLAGQVIAQTDVARFTRILGTLLKSGVAMIPALTVVKDMLSNQVLARAVGSLGDGVRRGAGLAQPMAETRTFPAAGRPHGAGGRGDRAARGDAAAGGGLARSGHAQARQAADRAGRALHHPGHGPGGGLHRGRHADGHPLRHRPAPMRRPMSIRRLLRDQRGFSLIELLVVIIILGLIAGLVGPRLFGRVGQSKVAAARAQIELFGAALDQYRLDIGAYPPAAPGLQALVQNPNVAAWNGPYLKKPAVPSDPWGRPYQYKCCPGDHGDYDIWTTGADGAPGGDGENADVTSWDVK